jgi:hypothetical protein
MYVEERCGCVTNLNKEPLCCSCSRCADIEDNVRESADTAMSFLQSLPADPMSHVVLNVALNEVLCKDPLLLKWC